MAHSDPVVRPFNVLFEDQHLLVLSKSSNVLSQGDSSGAPSLVDHLRIHFGRNYVGLIHRLDRNTTGLMVVGKRSKSADRLSDQLKNGELRRSYHAILTGHLSGEAPHHWEHWLLKNEKTNEVRVVAKGTPGAKAAALQVVALQLIRDSATQTPLTLARFTLETGRSHQIRVQSMAMNHPLIGDSKYGNPEAKTLFSRPALHSAILDFKHPMSGAPLHFEELWAPDMAAFLGAQAP